MVKAASGHSGGSAAKHMEAKSAEYHIPYYKLQRPGETRFDSFFLTMKSLLDARPLLLLSRERFPQTIEGTYRNIDWNYLAEAEALLHMVRMDMQKVQASSKPSSNWVVPCYFRRMLILLSPDFSLDVRPSPTNSELAGMIKNGSIVQGGDYYKRSVKKRIGSFTDTGKAVVDCMIRLGKQYYGYEGGEVTKMSTIMMEFSCLLDPLLSHVYHAIHPEFFVQAKERLFDMAGNVAEWLDGGEEVEKQIRGGGSTDQAVGLRANACRWKEANLRDVAIGFRCVQ